MGVKYFCLSLRILRLIFTYCKVTFRVIWIRFPYFVTYCKVTFRVIWIRFPYFVTYCKVTFKVIWIRFPYFVTYCKVTFRVIWSLLPIVTYRFCCLISMNYSVPPEVSSFCSSVFSAIRLSIVICLSSTPAALRNESSRSLMVL